MKHIFFNDCIVPLAKASVPARDLSLLRGYGIFDYLRTHRRIPLFLSDYLDRFYLSAEKMGLTIGIAKNELPGIIQNLIGLHDYEECGIRLVLTGGESADAFHPGKSSFMIFLEPFFHPDERDYTEGVAVLSVNYARFMPEIKSISYLPVVYHREELKKHGAVDVLYHHEGKVTELSRSNLFIVKAGKVITNDKGILKGITRKQVFDLISHSYPFELRDFSLSELLDADEVFLSSTTKKVMPIVRVDDKKISSGKVGNISSELYQAFLKHADDYVSNVLPISF